jgi:CubicO group peptidase (beta-lactamase class C family)
MFARTLISFVVAVCISGCDSPEPLETPVEEATLAAEESQVPETVRFSGSMFTGAEQYDNFYRLHEFFPSHAISASPSPHPFKTGPTIELPEAFEFNGASINVQDFLNETDTAALLVIKDGQIRYENYWLTGGPGVHWISWSVGKSFVSALVGIAIEEGLIESVEVPITRYVPALNGSAYDKVRIKDILQMSSGARWTENYGDPDSDISRYAEVFATGASLDDFTASLVREREPGTYNYYNSTDTQALGMLLVKATGRSLASYAEEKLFHPVGMENNAYWLSDNAGMEMAAGGLMMTARDYAKLGQLYLQRGSWQGKQIVPGNWVDDSLKADGPHLQAEAHPDYPVGYGYQWWLPVSSEGEFSGIGIYNQFVFVNPTRNMVIVKLSANSNYGGDPATWAELESFELFRAIAYQLD